MASKLSHPCLRSGESSETIRRPSRRTCDEMKRWSGPYGDVGRLVEISSPPNREVVLHDLVYK